MGVIYYTCFLNVLPGFWYFDHILPIAVTDVKTGDYLSSPTCISGTHASNGSALINVTDRENTTCVNVKQNHNDWLQAVFQFPSTTFRRDMSAEVVVRNAKDCSSVNWNWFVESTCAPKTFRECQKSTVSQQLYYSRCVVSCHCTPMCDYLYLKYTPAMYEDQSEEQLCDVYLDPHRPVIPEARGLLLISSAMRQP